MKYNMVREYEIQAFERLQNKKIMRCFCDALKASTTAKILSINRNTINVYFNEFRVKILENSIKEHSKEFGVFEHNVFELDEIYFGSRRIRGKRRRGAAGKTPVFGLLKRNGKVFVTVVPNCSKEALMPVIQGKILKSSTIYTEIRTNSRVAKVT